MKILNYILSVMLLMFCLPAAAWAEQVPAVTEAEYRYYLEYYARNYLEETDYRSYDDTQLRAMLIENVEQSVMNHHRSWKPAAKNSWSSL